MQITARGVGVEGLGQPQVIQPQMPTHLIDQRKLVALVGVVLALVAANVVNQVAGMPFWPITKMIYLGHESNLPTWCSSLLLALAAVLCLDCQRWAKAAPMRGAAQFFLLGGLMLAMSCDEVAQIHEAAGHAAMDQLGLSTKSFAKHTGWVWVGGPVVVLLFLLAVGMTYRLFAAAPGSIWLLAGGFGMIAAGGVFLEAGVNFLNRDNLLWLWQVEVVVEESLEMLGTLAICLALIRFRDVAALRATSASAKLNP